MFDELISAVTDTAAFSESLHSYLSHFSFNSAIIVKARRLKPIS